jgi:hypothetical protein
VFALRINNFLLLIWKLPSGLLVHASRDTNSLPPSRDMSESIKPWLESTLIEYAQNHGKDLSAPIIGRKCQIFHVILCVLIVCVLHTDRLL